MGQSPPSESYNNEGKGLPFIQGNAEFGFKYAEPIQFTSDPKKIAEKDDILISVRAPVGDVNFAPYKLSIGRGLAAIRPNQKKLNIYYIFYSLKHHINQFHALSTGSTFKAISKRDFDAFLLPIPPLFEQRGIVEVLGTVDECIRLTDEVIGRAEELKRGLMQRLLTRGIGHTEYKQTPLGEIPETWKIEKLNKLIKIQSGNYFKYEEFVPQGVKVLKIDNVSFGKISWDTITYLPENYLDEYRELKLNKNDIVIALNRPIIDDKLKIGIIDKNDVPSILYQRVGRIMNKNIKILNSKYLFYYVSSLWFINDLKRISRGTDQPYINPTEIIKLNITIPPPIEQNKIVDRIELADSIIRNEFEKNKSYKILKQGLMQVLFSGKIRVELRGDGLHRIEDS